MDLPTRKPPASRIRVSDKVLQTFEYACLMQDVEVAERLLGLLEFMSARKARRFGGDRRASEIDLEPLQERLRAATEQREFGRRNSSRGNGLTG